jgi:hypothetical protein
MCKGMGSLANAMNAMAEAENEHVGNAEPVKGMHES